MNSFVVFPGKYSCGAIDVPSNITCITRWFLSLHYVWETRDQYNELDCCTASQIDTHNPHVRSKQIAILWRIKWFWLWNDFTEADRLNIVLIVSRKVWAFIQGLVFCLIHFWNMGSRNRLLSTTELVSLRNLAKLCGLFAEMMRQAVVGGNTPSPRDRSVTRQRERTRFASPGK